MSPQNKDVTHFWFLNNNQYYSKLGNCWCWKIIYSGQDLGKIFEFWSEDTRGGYKRWQHQRSSPVSSTTGPWIQWKSSHFEFCNISTLMSWNSHKYKDRPENIHKFIFSSFLTWLFYFSSLWRPATLRSQSNSSFQSCWRPILSEMKTGRWGEKRRQSIRQLCQYSDHGWMRRTCDNQILKARSLMSDGDPNQIGLKLDLDASQLTWIFLLKVKHSNNNV